MDMTTASKIRGNGRAQGHGGAVRRLLTAAGAAVAIAAATPGVAMAQSVRDTGYGQRYDNQNIQHRYQTVDGSQLDEEFWGDDYGYGFEGQTYGEVNYERSKGYGDFSYYDDQPPGRYTYPGASPSPDWRYGQSRDFTLDDSAAYDRRYQQQTVRTRDRLNQDRYGQAGYTQARMGQQGMYEQHAQFGDGRQMHGDLPRANVRLHGMNVSAQDRGGVVYQQAGQFDRDRQRFYTQDVGRFDADRYDRDAYYSVEGQALSYGDVNYEESLGYGEFSYYDNQPPGRYEYRGASRPFDPTTGRYEPARLGGGTDWQADDDDFDTWYDNGR